MITAEEVWLETLAKNPKFAMKVANEKALSEFKKTIEKAKAAYDKNVLNEIEKMFGTVEEKK